MGGTDYFIYATPAVYWALILCWSAILIFYARQYRYLRHMNPLIATLLVVIFIDGTRTLIESLYFGAWYTARSHLLFPYSVYQALERPEYVIIPKAINLLAALVIILVIIRAWFPRVQQVTKQHQELERLYHDLRESEAAREELTHLIVHDMRTPLTSVMGTLETMRDQQLDERTRHELVTDAFAASKHLLADVNQLLDVSTMEAGQVALERKQVDLAGVVEEAMRQVRPLALEKRMKLQAQLPQEPITLSADRQMLARVLVNLLGNAVKFTPAGGQVTAAAQLVEGGSQVQVSVSDTGPGIPAEALDRVFDKFFRVRSPETAKAVGTGLGLTFCKLAVEAHGGRLWVESEPGQGSTFRFILPLGT